MPKTYRVLLYGRPRAPGQCAERRVAFNIQASTIDGARRAAKAEAAKRGHALHGINFAQRPGEMFAYIKE